MEHKNIVSIVKSKDLDTISDMLEEDINSMELNNWGFLTSIRVRHVPSIMLFLDHPQINIHVCDDLAFHILITNKDFHILQILMNHTKKHNTFVNL